ncbi:Putative R3H domain-containing protein [Septoria linicola]|uniref:R3H domain-containing protein n=1 Tax=Septoria linicola TaxID=215465 RepID=A0A9Q9EKY2_9PEZI|nr:putative R3H domain-containing protein [Septoria linicola]USW54540.1 Putative R3H domain-containing protein [Septoria linicola]
MAILPELPVDSVAMPPPATSIERVEAWTVSQAADVLAATSLSSPSARTARGATVTIDIPLDEQALREAQPRPKNEAVHTVHKRREPIRRDSVKRREALLKGKEGSRRRQRWENDRLLSNPHAEPPLPSDWQVQPTHTVQAVPYFLAPLWDAQYARQSKERERRAAAAKAPASKEEAMAAQVTSELRSKLKKSRGAKNLLQGLEEEVRGFVCQWDEKQKELESEGLIEPDSSDDEIVFVGRNGAMSDDKKKEKEDRHLQKDKLIFQSLVDDHGAAFGRYLVHSIAAYYGLKTWSVTTGNPARREAYIGLKVDPTTRRPSLTRSEMPRPLWTVV